MFEAYTYDNLLEEVLENAPDGIDTRQGSIFYDAISGILMKIAKLYTDMEYVFELLYIDTTTGDYLDKRAVEYGITRNAATPAQYYVTFDGTTPDVGERFYYDGVYFVLCQDDSGIYYLEAEEAGESGNTIYSGTPAIPVNTIDDLTSATFGLLYSAGAEAESDDSLRARIQEKISGPTENGNKQQYKYWCESVEGVGHATIYPLWNGPNTVKAVLTDTSAKPCSTAVIAAVQEYIDPATKGYTTEVDGKTYTVGDGLGEGVAEIGAHFTASAADELTLTVEFSAELTNGATEDQVISEATAGIEAYLQELVLETSSSDTVIVRVNAIGAIISSLSSILDYSDLTINGGTSNITPADDEVPVLSEVVINVI